MKKALSFFCLALSVSAIYASEYTVISYNHKTPLKQDHSDPTQHSHLPSGSDEANGNMSNNDFDNQIDNLLMEAQHKLHCQEFAHVHYKTIVPCLLAGLLTSLYTGNYWIAVGSIVSSSAISTFAHHSLEQEKNRDRAQILETLQALLDIKKDAFPLVDLQSPSDFNEGRDFSISPYEFALCDWGLKTAKAKQVQQEIQELLKKTHDAQIKHFKDAPIGWHKKSTFHIDHLSGTERYSWDPEVRCFFKNDLTKIKSILKEQVEHYPHIFFDFLNCLMLHGKDESSTLGSTIITTALHKLALLQFESHEQATQVRKDIIETFKLFFNAGSHPNNDPSEIMPLAVMDHGGERNLYYFDETNEKYVFMRRTTLPLLTLLTHEKDRMAPSNENEETIATLESIMKKAYELQQATPKEKRPIIWQQMADKNFPNEYIITSNGGYL